ncbi:MAG TPA: hypothetical protein V6C97_19555 [Oculatellaceae cyanobacterium]
MTKPAKEKSRRSTSKPFGRISLKTVGIVALVTIAISIEVCLIAMIILPKSPLGSAAFMDSFSHNSEPEVQPKPIDISVTVDDTENWDKKFLNAQDLMNAGKISDSFVCLQSLKSEVDKGPRIEDPVLRRKLVLARLLECAIGLRDTSKTAFYRKEFQEITKIDEPYTKLPKDLLSRPQSQQLTLIGEALDGQRRVDSDVMEPLLEDILKKAKSLPAATRARATVYLCLCYKSNPAQLDKAKLLAKEARGLVSRLPKSPQTAMMLYNLSVIYWDLWHKGEEVEDICREASAMLNDQVPDDYVRLATTHGFLAYLERLGPQKNLKLSLEHSRRALDDLEGVSRQDARGELARAFVERQIACVLEEQKSPESFEHYVTSLHIVESPVCWKVGWLDGTLTAALEPFISYYKKNSRLDLAAGFANRVKLIYKRSGMASGLSNDGK